MSSLRDQITALRKTLRARAKATDAALTRLEGLTKGKGALDHLGRLCEALDATRDIRWGLLGMSDDGDRWREALEAEIDQRRGAARVKAIGELKLAAKAEGVELQRLTDQPPAFVLSPLVVTFDFERGAALIEYAREVIAEAPLEAAAILTARREAMENIRAAAVPSIGFFDRLHAAYRVARVARGLPLGERVDLVELLAPLALMSTDSDRWRQLDWSSVEPYPRAMLSYQLSRLRRDRALERHGWRLELGTATGGSTRDKRNVLYVPTSPTEGQYYLSIRFSQR